MGNNSSSKKTVLIAVITFLITFGLVFTVLFLVNNQKKESNHSSVQNTETDQSTAAAGDSAASEITEAVSETETETVTAEVSETAAVSETEAENVSLTPVFSSASSSSELVSEYLGDEFISYEAANVLDTDLGTSWGEGVDGYGEGEFIVLYANGKQRLNRISVYNGICSREEIFYKNGRIKDCTVEFSDGSKFDVTLNGDYAAQPQSIDFTGNIDTDFIKITIKSAYTGTKYTDTCVSGISAEYVK